MSRLVYELCLYGLNDEIAHIADDISKEAYKICECNNELESITVGPQHILFCYSGMCEKTGVLQVLTGCYEEYPGYNCKPSNIFDFEYQYVRVDEDNIKAYKLIALLLKYVNNDSMEEREKIVFAINIILSREVFRIASNPFFQQVTILDEMDLMKCIEYLEDSQNECGKTKFYFNDLFSCYLLKDCLDSYFSDKLGVDVDRVSEEDNYYCTTQKLIKEGGKAYFGDYGDVSLELANYNNIFQLAFKISLPEKCWRIYDKTIMEIEYNAGKALEISGDIVDVSYEKANLESKKAIDYWISKVKRLAESMKIVVRLENNTLVWEEAFYCESPNIDIMMKRISDAYERFEDVVIQGIDADFDVFDEEYREILESYLTT